jgi:4'-phosphopantetheinyl transferase
MAGSDIIAYDKTTELPAGKVDIYYGESESLAYRYSEMKSVVSEDERSKANKFHNERDRLTYILSHSMLRLTLAKYLNEKPSGIYYRTGLNQKPYLASNALQFNLTHTREAFAFAISRTCSVGIDLENIDNTIDINSISSTYFSQTECDFIFEAENEAINRFYFLWTRKEAFLKALGTGIQENLLKVEVNKTKGIINSGLAVNGGHNPGSAIYYLYSRRIGDSYLSLALPQKTSFMINNLKEDKNLFSILT